MDPPADRVQKEEEEGPGAPLLHDLIDAACSSESGEEGWGSVIAHINPSACRVVSDRFFRKLPLHLALHKSAPDAVILGICSAYPGGASIRDGHGNLPIHLAALHSGSAAVVAGLLEAYPQGCRDASNAIEHCGRLALHLAVRQHAQEEVLRQLVEADKATAAVQDADGFLPLHHVFDRQWIEELRTDQLPLQRGERPPQGDATNSSWTEPDINPARQLLVSAYPLGVRITNGDGELPLHVALANPFTTLVQIQRLLELYPQSVSVRGLNGEFPVVVAAQAWAPDLSTRIGARSRALARSCGEIVRLLLDQFPDAATMTRAAAGKSTTGIQEEFSYLPLDLAVGNQAPVEVVRAILTAFPDAVQGHLRSSSSVVGRSGYIRTSNLEASDDKEATVRRVTQVGGPLLTLLRQSPEGEAPKHSWGVLNGDRVSMLQEEGEFTFVQILSTSRASADYVETPLTTALRCSAPTDVLALLLQHYPAAMNVKTRRGFYPIDTAVQNNDNANWIERKIAYLDTGELPAGGTMVKRLLTAFEYQSSREANVDDSNLMHIALSCGAPCKEPWKLIEHISRVYPDATESQNPHGDLPLHVAARRAGHSRSSDTLVFEPLLRKRHCQRANAYSDLPLHAALGGEIITAHFTDDTKKLGIVFGDHWPYIKRLDDKEDCLAHVVNGLETGCRLLAIDGEVLPEGYEFEQAKARVQKRPLTLVFIAPRKHAPSSEVVQLLLKNFPDASRKLGCHGLLPIHLVLQTCHLSTVADDAIAILKAITNIQPDSDSSWWMDCLDSKGRRPLEVAAASEVRAVRHWARTFNAFLGRYRVDEGPPVHLSRGCKAVFASDLSVSPPEMVALKMMKHRSSFEREIFARKKDGRDLTGAVIGILRWHTPAGETFFVDGWQCQEEQHTETGDEHPYILVLERGERSLHDACAKERIAGYELETIKHVMRCTATCVRKLHATGLIHADLKPRNVLRKGHKKQKTKASDSSWILCDMDASAEVDTPAGTKTSSAYAPPELAVAKYAGHHDSPTVLAARSFDIWSLGVILYEMCTGHTLFSQDTSNDELRVDMTDRTRLCSWLCISDEMLAPVFVFNEELKLDPDECMKAAVRAKDLIRWSLQGDPTARPTIEEFLAHPFLAEVSHPDGFTLRPMRYHAFMSHAQADASGTVGTLFFAYARLGLHNWIDMRQQLLTLDGMKQGVRDSSIFLLILTEHVLGSWFCQQELLCAIAEGKQIQLVIETDTRFNPFDQAAWEAFNKCVETGGSASFEIMSEQIDGVDEQQTVCRVPADVAGSQFDKLPSAIRDAINASLKTAVIYRRRDFEQEAMMRELCARNGVALPPINPREDLLVSSAHDSIVVFVVCQKSTAGSMLTDILDELQACDEIVLSNLDELQACDELVVPSDPADIDKASKVLLLLSPNVLTPPSLELLEKVLRIDEDTRTDRICAVFDERTGWRFGCAEQKGAPEIVQNCLAAHEALAYRPKDRTNRLPHRHEFPAFIRKLLQNLGSTRPTAVASAAGAALAEGKPPSQQERSQEQRVEQLRRSLADKEAEVALLRAELSRHTAR